MIPELGYHQIVVVVVVATWVVLVWCCFVVAVLFMLFSVGDGSGVLALVVVVVLFRFGNFGGFFLGGLCIFCECVRVC